MFHLTLHYLNIISSYGHPELLELDPDQKVKVFKFLNVGIRETNVGDKLMPSI